MVITYFNIQLVLLHNALCSYSVILYSLLSSNIIPYFINYPISLSWPLITVTIFIMIRNKPQQIAPNYNPKTGCSRLPSLQQYLAILLILIIIVIHSNIINSIFTIHHPILFILFAFNYILLFTVCIDYYLLLTIDTADPRLFVIDY